VMVGLRLGRWLVLLPSLFILTGLSQNFDVPDARPPGRGQLGGSIRKYCPICGIPLSRLRGNVLACDDCGVIREDEALNSPPPES
jgi:hypothetical protein